MAPQLTKQQMQTLGIEDYSIAQRDAFLMKIGKTVFDGAIIKLLNTLSEDQMHALHHAIESYDSFDAVLQYLEKSHPSFSAYLTEGQNQFIDRFADEVKDLGV